MYKKKSFIVIYVANTENLNCLGHVYDITTRDGYVRVGPKVCDGYSEHIRKIKNKLT